MSKPRSVDIAIVGGGMVGLLLARTLANAAPRPLSIAVVEASRPAPVEGTDIDLRVSALSPASLQSLDTAGALAALPDHVRCDYECMRVWQDVDGPDGSSAIRFAAAESGAPRLGAIIENRSLRAALWTLVENTPGCECVVEAANALHEENEHCVLKFADHVLHARLVVAADGANSWVRSQLGIGCRERSHGANALVAHLATERPHAATAWQKFLPGGPVALLPLADGRVSLVWSHPEEDTETLLALSDHQFSTRLSADLDHALGELRCTTPRRAFPLVTAHAQRYTGRRFALVGDAAHRVHPLAGQGANLGIRDAACLAEALCSHMSTPWADPGDPRVLRRYERARKGDNALTLGTMVGLDTVFRSSLAGLAGVGMGLVDRSGPLKNWFAHYAMGAQSGG